MVIARLARAEVAYGAQRLLDQAELTLHRGERVVLVGRNGAGKSTLLKVLAGEVALDDGELWLADTLKVSCLSQDVPEALDRTLYEVVVDGLGELGTHLAAYHQLAQQAGAGGETLRKLDRLEANIDTLGGWSIDSRVSRVIEELSLPGELLLSDCSGGMRRRAMLAQALVSDPDLLLLDEPTNHLDIDAIDHLQTLLLASSATLVVVTHDRALIDVLASRIVEVDRGRLLSYPGDYRRYVEQKTKAEAEEAIENRKFDQVLAQEESWIREGIKARRTRNEGRVRRLQSLRSERAQRLDKPGNVRLKLDEGGRSGALVADLESVSFGYEVALIEDFSTTIRRQDRVGIIGPNGCGKSTLIRLMLGELQPHAGKVNLGTGLQVAYFDQQRSALRSDLSVRESVGEGSDYVEINGKRKHVAGYLADFLFPSRYLNVPVGQLSGGERNRLLMARLFARPANLLVLDEPTNDLDVETLELLEELLSEFAGTIVLVSHDRRFLDRVVTSTIVFEGGGQLREYVGGYSDWQRQHKAAALRPAEVEAVAKSRRVTSKSRRLSYNDQRELDALPERIEALEASQVELEREVGAPGFYDQPPGVVHEKLQTLADRVAQIEAAYARWQALSDAADPS